MRFLPFLLLFLGYLCSSVEGIRVSSTSRRSLDLAVSHRHRLQLNSSESNVVTLFSGGCDFNCWLKKLENCWKAWDKIQCAKDILNDAVKEVKNLGSQLKSKLEEAKQLGEQLLKIKPAIEALGKCLKTLPGGDIPITDALNNILNSFQKKELPKYLSETYVNPMIQHVDENVKKGLDIAANAFKTEVNMIENNEMSPEVFKEMPKRLISSIDELKDVDPTVRCLTSDSFMDDMFKNDALIDLFGELVKDILDGLKHLWDKLTGPGSFIGGLVEELTKAVAAQIAIFLPAKDELEAKITTALGNYCTANVNQVLGFISGVDVPAEFCVETTGSSIMENSVESGIAFVMSTILEFCVEKFMGFLKNELWLPLLQHVISFITAAQSSIMQGINGIAGLIPEAGGPVSMLVTIPLSSASDQLIGELASTTVKGLIDDGERWLLDQIPEWSKVASSHIVQAFTNGSVANAVPPELKAFGDDVGEGMQMLVPVVKMVEPFTKLALQLTFPKVDEELTKCRAKLNKLVPLVQSKQELCTNAPTGGPTTSPTVPTSSPTPGPTPAPTPGPTPGPTKSPTKSPTKAPTKSPTKSPTKAPIVMSSTPPPPPHQISKPDAEFEKHEKKHDGGLKNEKKDGGGLGGTTNEGNDDSKVSPGGGLGGTTNEGNDDSEVSPNTNGAPMISATKNSANEITIKISLG